MRNKSFRNILVLSVVVLSLAFSNAVFAAGSISISSISIPSSANQGDTFSITVYISGSEATSVSGTLTLPSGLSCTPSGSQSISLSGSGTGSATWSCTADVAGDYTSQITASVSATDSGTGGSLSDSEQTGLSVLSPSSLTTTSSLSSSSITTAGSSSFTVAVHNTGDQSTTYSISVSSSPSGVSATVASGSASGTATGGSVTNVIYTLSATTASTYTVTATVTSGDSQTVTTSKTLDVSATSSNTTNTTSSSSGGGGGSGTTTSIKKTVLFDTITPGVSGVVKNIDKDMGVTQMLISVNTAVSSVTVSIDKLSAKPSTVPDVSGKVYKYLNVEKSINNTIIKQVTFNFAVEKSWLTANNIDEGTVRLYRYTAQWDKLTTVKLSSNNTHVMYESTSPGLSYFSIAGESTTVQCNSGDKQCSGDQLQECSNKLWVTTQTCSNGCDNSTLSCKTLSQTNTTDQINAECTSGTKRCVANEVQECSSGTWVRSIVCALGCNNEKNECNSYTNGNTTGSGSSIPMDYVYLLVVFGIALGLGAVYFKYFKTPGKYHFNSSTKKGSR